jgi:hypothetical protein
VDRTVLPGNPGEEAADGVVGAEDRASTADSPHRASKDRDSGRGAIRPKAAARTAITGGRVARIAKSSAANAPGR